MSGDNGPPSLPVGPLLPLAVERAGHLYHGNIYSEKWGNKTTGLVVKALSGSLWVLVQRMLEPGFTYFMVSVSEGGSLFEPLEFFRKVRLLDPKRINALLCDDDTMEELRHAHQNNLTIPLEQLKSELPKYKALAQSSDPNVDFFVFWKGAASSIPGWAALARRAALVLPSSCAAERVFSILKHMFDSTQTHALDDYVGTALKLRVNDRDTC